LLHGVGRHFVNVGLAVLAGLGGVLALILSLLLIPLLILVLVPVVPLGHSLTDKAERQGGNGDRETCACYKTSHFHAPSVGHTDRVRYNSARPLEIAASPKIAARQAIRPDALQSAFRAAWLASG
jgi:hypothetical protein